MIQEDDISSFQPKQDSKTNCEQIGFEEEEKIIFEGIIDFDFQQFLR